MRSQVLRRVAMGPRLCPDGLGSAYLTLGVLWPPPATGSVPTSRPRPLGPLVALRRGCRPCNSGTLSTAVNH
jgi:hypothetical protein